MPQRPDRPFRSRLRGIAGTLAVLALAGLVVTGGFAAISRPSDAPRAQAPLTPVGVMQVDLAPGYQVTRRFTGQIEARTRADFAFELGGRVTEVLVEEGDLVAAGAVLARLETSALAPQRAALEAELAASAADAELARLTLARNDALAGRGVRSVAAQDEARLALARAEARMAALRAQIAGVDVSLEKSVLRAPFDARIGGRMADPGQTVAAGQTVLVLFDAAPARLRVGLPPELAAGLAPGDAVTVDLGGGPLGAEVLFIRPDLDPATRSRAVVIRPEPGALVLGETGDLVLTQQIPEPGFWAPLSALREGVRGAWSVMAVEAGPAGDRVVAAAVEVIHTDGPRVFLRGALPPGARILGAGPDRVAPGQIVDVLLAATEVE